MWFVFNPQKQLHKCIQINLSFFNLPKRLLKRIQTNAIFLIGHYDNRNKYKQNAIFNYPKQLLNRIPGIESSRFVDSDRRFWPAYGVSDCWNSPRQVGHVTYHGRRMLAPTTAALKNIWQREWHIFYVICYLFDCLVYGQPSDFHIHGQTLNCV